MLIAVNKLLTRALQHDVLLYLVFEPTSATGSADGNLAVINASLQDLRDWDIYLFAVSEMLTF